AVDGHGVMVAANALWKDPDRLPGTMISVVETRHCRVSHSTPLGAVVGSFKAAVSYWCGTHNLECGWQARFHDRIIRGKNSLKAVRQYIRENPANWRKDMLFVA